MPKLYVGRHDLFYTVWTGCVPLKPIGRPAPDHNEHPHYFKRARTYARAPDGDQPRPLLDPLLEHYSVAWQTRVRAVTDAVGACESILILPERKDRPKPTSLCWYAWVARKKQ